MPGTRAKLSSAAAATMAPSIESAAAACRALPLIPRTFIAPGPSLATRWVRDEKVADREVIEIALQERPDRIVGRADDRLLVHVEAGVDQRRDAGELMVFGENAMKARVRRRRHQLRPRGAIDVDRRRR